MQTVFAVGVMVLQLDKTNQKFDASRQRLWYLFSTFKEAEEAVLTNSGDMFESYYNVALIEEVPLFGTEAIDDQHPWWGTQQQWWYYADFNSIDEFRRENPKVAPIPVPKGFENIVNWWVG